MLMLLLALTADPAPPTLRLPPGVRPTHYALDLTVVPAQPSFSGTVTIDLQLDAPTALVWLNAEGLHIAGAELRSGSDNQAARIVTGNADFVGFAATRPLPKGPAQLTVHFAGTLDSDKSQGLYRVAEGKGADDWYAYTFFEPIDARRAFPCFDEPGYKVPWQLTLHVRKTHVALANAPLIKEVDESNGMKAVTFAESKPLPSYLVAFMVGPFEVIDGGSSGARNTKIRFVIPRGRAKELHYALSVTPRIVTELEAFFGTPYPYEKLDVAVVPRYWGTMEHPGLVAVGQPLTLIKPGEEGLERQQSFANVTVHELAHHWFGDLVTCRWWNDVWLNESLGTFADRRVTNALEPQWKFMLGRSYSGYAMKADGLRTVQALRSAVTTKDAIHDSFDNDITYFKGEAVLGMLEHWVGSDKFVSALRKYLAAHAWGNADAGEFVADLRTNLGREVATVMQSFIDQPGLPIVTSAVRCDGAKAHVTLTQKRFFNTSEAASGVVSSALWTVPVCMKWNGGASCTVLDKATAQVELPVCPAWLTTNADAMGYYRVRYDHASLEALQKIFARELTVNERINIVDDVMAEVEEGSLSLTDALMLLPNFLADADPRVFGGGVNLLMSLRPKELPAQERAAFGRAATVLLAARAKSLGWAPQAGEDPALAGLRASLIRILGTYARDPAIFAEAHREALLWLRDPKAVPSDMVQIVLEFAGAGGDAKLFDQLLARARATEDRRERGLVVGALGAFSSAVLRDRALGLVLTPEFDPRETIGIVYALLDHYETRDAAWAWLQVHFKDLVAKMREDEAMGLFSSIPSAFCEESHRAAVAAFLEPQAKSQPGAPHVLADALESAKVCVASAQRDRTAMSAFLSHY